MRPFFLFLAYLASGLTPRDSVAGQSLSQLSEYSAGKLANSLDDERRILLSVPDPWRFRVPDLFWQKRRRSLSGRRDWLADRISPA